MKTGDLVRRKDMPSMVYKIKGTSTSSDWHNMWVLELVSPKSVKARLKSTGMISKDDTRWEVVEK